jgi:hypothetical protein
LRIRIAESKYVKGIGSLDETAYDLDEYDIDEALKTKWDSDAHFVTYESDGPRYRKTISYIQPVLTQLLVFDYDNQEHREWEDDDQVEAWMGVVNKVVDNYYAIYTTRSGGRIILRLANPINVRQAEILHKQIVSKWAEAGLEVDPNCSDWTRLFRLPFVVRDGKQTSESQFAMLQINGSIYSPGLVPEIPIDRDIRDVKNYIVLSEPQPSPEARKLVWRD